MIHHTRFRGSVIAARLAAFAAAARVARPMTRYRNHAIACLVVAAFACAPGSVFAQARFYGGGTTWDTTTANWSTVSGGPYNTTWTGTGIATFQGTSGTVGFNTVTATSVDFSVTGYVLNGNTLNMGGTSTLNVARG